MAMCLFPEKFGGLPSHSICDWYIDCEGCRYNSDTNGMKKDFEYEVCANCGQVDCRARDLIPPEKQPVEPCDSWIPNLTNQKRI